MRVNTAAISPPIDLSVYAAPITLEFFENYYTQLIYDCCMVDVSTDYGLSWTSLRGGYGAAPSGNSGGWVMTVLDLSAYEGELIKLRFYFDTDNPYVNSYPGWFFDDVLVTSPAFAFLSVNPPVGSIPAGDSLEVAVTFDAAGMWGGDYEGTIDILSNDPDESIVSIETFLHVTEAPDIAVSDDTLDFGDVFIGSARTDTVIVSNVGTAPLLATDVATDDPHYTVNLTWFYITAGNSQLVFVTFTPTTIGPVSGTLTILSDDPDEPIVTVALEGAGLQPPDIDVVPNSLADTLFEGESSIHLLTISNIGFNNLSFTVIAVDTVGSGVAAEFDGIDDYVQANQVNSDFITVEAWVNFDYFFPDYAGHAFISNSHGDGKGYMFYQGVGPPYNQLAGFIGTTSGLKTMRAWLPLLTNQWYHAAMTYDGSEFRFYVNGELEALENHSGTILPVNVTDHLLFGCTYTPEESRFQGLLDEISIWDHARSQSDIRATMYQGLTGTEAGLLGYWNFESIRPWDDRTLNGNDGTPFYGVGLVPSSAPFAGWISFDPVSGVVPADSSISVMVTFNSSFMLGGDHYADIIILSDDPDEPEDTVSAYLHVIGVPEIAVSPDSIDLGQVFIGNSAAYTVTVFNENMDSLTVNDISSDNPQFTVDTTSFHIGRLDSQKVEVTFTPTSATVESGTLTIASDDPDEPTVTVEVQGEGLIPPDISTIPDSLVEDLYTGDTSTQTLTIHNTGANNLDWYINLVNLSDPPKKLFTLTPPVRATHSAGEETSEATSIAVPTRSSPIEAALADLTGIDILFDRFHDEFDTSWWAIIIADLTARGATVTENFLPITPDLLSGYDVIWVTDLYIDFSAAELTAVQSWMSNGGALLLEGDGYYSTFIYNSILSSIGSGIEYSDVNGVGGITADIFPHQTTEGVDSILLQSNNAHLSSVTEPASVLINDTDGVANTAYSIVEFGRIVATADELCDKYHIGSADNQLFANQIFDWLAADQWLSVSVISGILPPDSSVVLDVTFNAAELLGNDYNANLVIYSNDPDESVVTVPIYLLVYGPVCGDINADGNGSNIADLTYLVDYLFRGGPPPPSLESANVDGNNGVNVADLTYLVDYLFRGGPEPVCGPVE